MPSIITYSPFLSVGVLVLGIYYDSFYVSLVGFCLMVASIVVLLQECGSDFREEIERANGGKQ